MKQLLTTALVTSTRLKPKLADDRRGGRLHGDGADGAGEGEHARLERVQAEAELQEQRQQKGHGADADAVEEAADHAGEEGIDLEQVEIEQGRLRRRARGAHRASSRSRRRRAAPPRPRAGTVPGRWW